ncbi:AAA family ATPase [Thioclava sp.]|uniref:AAA family ATPase n=1 Tax=Thioclava sp. TaxID=1933450 RepID=UPI003241F43D
MTVADDPWAGMGLDDETSGNVVRFQRPVEMDDVPFAPPREEDMQFVPDGPQLEEPDEGLNVSWPTAYDFFDEASLKPRQWIYGKHYLRSFVSVLASAGGIGKTSMQIVEALAICTGRPLLGEQVHERSNVWIINLEDPLEEMRRRVLAAMKHYGIRPDEVRGKLFLDAGRDFRIKFATQTRDGVIPNAALVAHMVEKIREHNIGIVFVDPFVSAHEVNENDNGAINEVVSQIRDVADGTECSIGLVHHIRKGNGDDATIDSVRGAGSLIGAARAARVINRVSEADALKLGVDDFEAKSIFRVDDGKANLAPPADRAVWRKMQGVQLDNGEWVGVCVVHEMPDMFEGISVKDTYRIQRLIAERDPGSLKANVQAKAWVGHMLGAELGIDTSDKAGRARMSHIVNAWVKSGVLKIEHVFDGRQGREVPSIVVGEWVHNDEI